MAQNLKQFLLHKGERLGMGVALLAMLVLVGLGAWSGLSSASPRETASDIKAKAERIQYELQHGAAESDPNLPALVLNDLDGQRVDVTAFATPTPVFIDTSIEDPRRRAPTLLAPAEFDGQVALVQAMNYYILPGDRPRVGVLLSREKKKTDSTANVARLLAARGPMPLDPRLTALLLQQAKLAELLAKQNQKPPGAALVNQPEYSLEFVDVDKVPAGARLATTVQPYRMAMVSASFPYRRQLEEYCRALRLPSIRALHDSREGLMPRFSKIIVRRRAIDERGRLAEDWRQLAVETDILPALKQAVRYGPLEPGEEALRPLVFNGLVMARPGLARGAYPRPNLKLLDQALQDFRAQTADNSAVLVAAPLERRIRGDGLSPFGDGASLEDQGKPPLRPNPVAKDAADPGAKELIVPEHCLVRFCDVNVRPGWTYEYQMKLRVENPNYGKPENSVAYPDLVKTREIEAENWAPRTPVRIAVAGDTSYYATELDDKTLTDKIRRDPRVKEVAFLEAPLAGKGPLRRRGHPLPGRQLDGGRRGRAPRRIPARQREREAADLVADARVLRLPRQQAQGHSRRLLNRRPAGRLGGRPDPPDLQTHREDNQGRQGGRRRGDPDDGARRHAPRPQQPRRAQRSAAQAALRRLQEVHRRGREQPQEGRRALTEAPKQVGPLCHNNPNSCLPARHVAHAARPLDSAANDESRVARAEASKTQPGPPSNVLPDPAPFFLGTSPNSQIGVRVAVPEAITPRAEFSTDGGARAPLLPSSLSGARCREIEAMTEGQSSPFMRRVGLLVGGTDPEGVIDARLLEAFSTQRDEAAFASLVQRHGPLVLSVCRRVLGHHQDAEDAFQATFLLLARKANSVRQHTSLRSWLYRVAYRVAQEARAKAVRRASHERCAGQMLVSADAAAGEASARILAACAPMGSTTALEQAELQRALLEEVARLPEDLRAAVLLCHFQGQTDQQAALVLGCPRGTVGSRLARARKRLRQGLAQRGHGDDVASLALSLGSSRTPPS